MKEVIEYLLRLEKERLIKGYALAGGTALLYYTEPILTYDVDIFILYPTQKGSFIDPTPLYRIAEEMGYKADKEHILIGSIPIQLLPAPDKLEIEAVEKAKVKGYGSSKIRVLSLEHLMAIMVKVGRAKDRARITKIIDDGVEYDRVELTRILETFNLIEKWERIRGKIT